MSVPILPCPFCCSAAKFGEVTTEGDNFGGQFIECTNPQCGCSTRLMFPLMDSVKELLAETWNRRTSESIMRKDSERLNRLQSSLSSVQFNNRIMKWTVQAHMQVVGCLSVGSTIREAIDNGTKEEAERIGQEEA